MGLFGRNKVDPTSQHRDWLLVSSIAQESLREQKRSRRWGILFKTLGFAYVLGILALFYQQSNTAPVSASKEHTALVSLDGEIAADQAANANDIVGGLRKAYENELSKAVILAINSPGGSPVQSAYIYDEIKRLQALYPEKKLYAVISDIGASGGYYIAAAADEIYANKSSLVGSIGVTAASFGFVGLMEKLGVERRSYTAGDHKGFLDPFSPEKEEEVVFWEGVLQSTHQQFIQAVRDGRGSRLVEDDKLFTGLVWNGEQAIDYGLVDGLGSAGYVAREIIKVEEIYDYTLRPSPFEQFAENFAIALGKGVGYVMNATFNRGVELR